VRLQAPRLSQYFRACLVLSTALAFTYNLRLGLAYAAASVALWWPIQTRRLPSRLYFVMLFAAAALASVGDDPELGGVGVVGDEVGGDEDGPGLFCLR